jgi:hypothetical protein
MGVWNFEESPRFERSIQKIILLALFFSSKDFTSSFGTEYSEHSYTHEHNVCSKFTHDPENNLNHDAYSRYRGVVCALEVM